VCQPSEGVDENPRWSLDGETQTSTAEQFRADTDRLERRVGTGLVLGPSASGARKGGVSHHLSSETQTPAELPHSGPPVTG